MTARRRASLTGSPWSVVRATLLRPAASDGRRARPPVGSPPGRPFGECAVLLEVDGLTKRYGEVAALEDLHLAIDRGDCVALVGHNGSGKTTAIGCVAGRLQPTSGSVRVDGIDIVAARDPVSARRLMSVIPDTAAFYPD